MKADNQAAVPSCTHLPGRQLVSELPPLGSCKGAVGTLGDRHSPLQLVDAPLQQPLQQRQLSLATQLCSFKDQKLSKAFTAEQTLTGYDCVKMAGCSSHTPQPHKTSHAVTVYLACTIKSLHHAFFFL